MDDDLTFAPGALVAGRVSLVVPSYNVEKYFEQFLQSILDQTYKDLEVILVNDGANEATTTMLREAVPRLEAEGYRVKLVEQANKGLGGAVDAGLKHFTGEFLMWPDPDDWLLPHSVERRVALMRENPDVGLLRTNAELYIDARGEIDGHFMPPDAPPRRPAELFEDLLFLRYFYAPVCHMVRSALFLKVHPTRSIYFDKRSSQNFQLLVPMVEAYPVLQVHEPLAVYRVRDDSRSRASIGSHEAMMRRFDQLLDLAMKTLPKLATYTPEGERVLRDFQWRNRMLPTAVRGAMHERCRAMITGSTLSPARKRLALALVDMRCSGALRRIDPATGRLLSRALARALDATVLMPAQAVRWPGGGPLWACEPAPVAVPEMMVRSHAH